MLSLRCFHERMVEILEQRTRHVIESDSFKDKVSDKYILFNTSGGSQYKWLECLQQAHNQILHLKRRHNAVVEDDRKLELIHAINNLQRDGYKFAKKDLVERDEMKIEGRAILDVVLTPITDLWDRSSKAAEVGLKQDVKLASCRQKWNRLVLTTSRNVSSQS